LEEGKKKEIYLPFRPIEEEEGPKKKKKKTTGGRKKGSRTLQSTRSLVFLKWPKGKGAVLFIKNKGMLGEEASQIYRQYQLLSLDLRSNRKDRA